MRSCYDLSLVSSLEIDKDSIDSDGNIYIKYKQYEGYSWRIDSSFFVFSGIDSFPLYYKLNALVGDTFTSEPPYIIARVIDIYPDTLWGVPTIVKKYDYWGIFDADSLWVGTRYLASGFGLIKYDFEPGDCHFLAGCIIDSVRYGWLVDVNESESIKLKFNLYPNYPNPFNPSTVIGYQLEVNTKVNLKIFNTLGQEVRTLVNEHQSAGYKRVFWDGRNNHGTAVGAGVYIYRLQAGSFVQSRKMILVK